MNQILETSNEKRGSSGKKGKSGKSPIRNSGGRGTASEKIAKVFAFILMVFAAVLIISGAMSIIDNNSEDSTKTVDTTQTVSTSAEINTTLDEANGTVILTVESEIAISKIIYNWNTNTEKTIDGQSQYTFETSIELPSGSNTLNVKVIDVDGNETKEAFDFDSESGDDIVAPTIEVTSKGSTLTITATDETEMSFLTYRWNDDEETTVNVDEDADDKTTIQVDIDIPEGSNTITIVAVDASSKYNTKTETKTIVGVKNPEITYELSEDGSEITFYCSHEDGIKQIYYDLNGQEYQIDYTDETGYETEVSFTQAWDAGYNLISVKVTSVVNTEATFDGEYTYEVSESSTEE